MEAMDMVRKSQSSKPICPYVCIVAFQYDNLRITSRKILLLRTSRKFGMHAVEYESDGFNACALYFDANFSSLTFPYNKTLFIKKKRKCLSNL